jgi:hypothetical protein
MFFLQTEGKKEPTSGLEPLTCSLRVRNTGVQGIAAACYGLQNPLI